MQLEIVTLLRNFRDIDDLEENFYTILNCLRDFEDYIQKRLDDGCLAMLLFQGIDREWYTMISEECETKKSLIPLGKGA